MLLATSSGADAAAGWSPDGQTLIYHQTVGDQSDLWMLPLGGDPTPFLVTEFHEGAPRVSPDGQWVAYVSDQAGENRVYVRPFPGGEGVFPISTGVGTEPVWSRDGGELFYRDGDQMLAVEITMEPTFRAWSPEALAQTPLPPPRPSSSAAASVRKGSRRSSAKRWWGAPC